MATAETDRIIVDNAIRKAYAMQRFPDMPVSVIGRRLDQYQVTQVPRSLFASRGNYHYDFWENEAYLRAEAQYLDPR
jgi:hypothetical protein